MKTIKHPCSFFETQPGDVFRYQGELFMTIDMEDLWEMVNLETGQLQSSCNRDFDVEPADIEIVAS